MIITGIGCVPGTVQYWRDGSLAENITSKRCSPDLESVSRHHWKVPDGGSHERELTKQDLHSQHRLVCEPCQYRTQFRWNFGRWSRIAQRSW